LSPAGNIGLNLERPSVGNQGDKLVARMHDRSDRDPDKKKIKKPLAQCIDSAAQLDQPSAQRWPW